MHRQNPELAPKRRTGAPPTFALLSDMSQQTTLTSVAALPASPRSPIRHRSPTIAAQSAKLTLNTELVRRCRIPSQSQSPP